MGALRLRFWFVCVALITVSVRATAGAAFPGADGRIVYSSEGECTASYCFRQLYTVVPGGSPVRITDPQGRDGQPAWSADGRKIAFERTTDRFDMHVVDAEGNNHLDLIQDDRFAWQIQPAWAPDGRRLAYIRYIPGSPGFGGDLHLFDTRDSADIALDVGRPLSFPESPRWRPDGERIAFVALVGGPGAVYSVNEDGTGLIRPLAARVGGFLGRMVTGRIEAVLRCRGTRLHQPPDRHGERRRQRSRAADGRQCSEHRSVWLPDGEKIAWRPSAPGRAVRSGR